MFSRTLALARDIKLSHSLFALPFALLAMFLAAGFAGRLPRWGEAGLIVACMVLARTFAMAVNRWADAGIDAQNPRTAGRAIPSGRLSGGFVLAAAGACAAGFVVVASGFWIFYRNIWPVLLSPAVLAYLGMYSFTKRFTWFCHLVLGVALALSPLAAALAIEPRYLARPDVYLLMVMVACWVAGFDVIYALQDVGIDREKSLRSMPANLGVEPALWISRLLHGASLAALIALAWICPQLHAGFAAGVGGVAILLVVEHALVWRSGTHHINVAFFTLNGVISLLLGGLGIADIVMRGGRGWG